MIAAVNAEEGLEKTESGDTKKTLDFKSEEKKGATVITPNFGAVPLVKAKAEKVIEELVVEEEGEEAFMVTPVKMGGQ